MSYHNICETIVSLVEHVLKTPEENRTWETYQEFFKDVYAQVDHLIDWNTDDEDEDGGKLSDIDPSIPYFCIICQANKPHSKKFCRECLDKKDFKLCKDHNNCLHLVCSTPLCVERAVNCETSGFYTPYLKYCDKCIATPSVDKPPEKKEEEEDVMIEITPDWPAFVCNNPNAMAIYQQYILDKYLPNF